MSATLVIGGSRSGKSRYASELARKLTKRPVCLATARSWDADFQARIVRHQADRGTEWRTVESETRLALPELAGEVVVVDCVTLWLTNLYFDHRSDYERGLELARAELDAALAQDTTWLFVANEVGMGLHASTEVGRKFADLHGFVNQFIAARAEAVCLMVAGIPYYVKGRAPCQM